MADQGEVSWPVENIPDQDFILRRIPKRKVKKDGTPSPGAFNNFQGGMSSDWDKYSTPQETRQRDSNPRETGVVKLSVRQVREIPAQTVEHTPKQNNRAHTDVFGPKDEEERTRLRRISQWVIRPDDPLEA